VFEAIRKIVEASPWLRRQAKVNADRITFPSLGASVLAVASDYASAAGANATISCFDELWAYTSERAHRLWDEMIPPPTRKVACRLTVTYAGFEGESRLLEGLYKRGLAQPLVGKDLHAGEGLLMFWSHDVVASWQTPEWVEQMRRSLRPNQFARMIENRFVSAQSAFVDMEAWDACVRLPGPLHADEGLPVFVGVDASTKRDSTALVAVAYQGQCVRLVAHKVFTPRPGDPIDFETTVVRTLREWHARFHVRKILFDPFQMAAVSQQLAGEGLPIEEYSMTLNNLTAATSNLFDLVSARQLALYPDDPMRLAVSRAVVSESSRGWKLDKMKQAHHIDVVVALSMAALAATRDGGSLAYDLDLSWIDGDEEHAGLSPRALDMAEKREFAMMQMRNYVLSGGGTRPPWSY
jgi:phage terminase large subunit-like protein